MYGGLRDRLIVSSNLLLYLATDLSFFDKMGFITSQLVRCKKIAHNVKSQLLLVGFEIKLIRKLKRPDFIFNKSTQLHLMKILQKSKTAILS